MKRHILLILCLIGGLATLQAQDPIFSQFYAAPLQMSPAFAGNSYAPRIALNYRNQWPGLGSPYVTYSASYEQMFEEFNSGIGLLLMADDAGDGIYKTTNFSLAYSYRLNITKETFAKFGTQFGGSQINLNWDKLLFADQIDRISGPSPGGVGLPTGEIKPADLAISYFDVGAGVLFYGPTFYAGISGKHLNTPGTGFINFNENLESGLPIRWSIHGGAQIELQERNRLQPGIFISPNAALIWQGDFAQLNVGAYVGFGMFFAGAWYRHANTNPDAAIGLVGVQKDIYKFGYSMDFTVSGLAAEGTGGSHEVSLVINFADSKLFQRQLRKQRHNDCFRLFR